MKTEKEKKKSVSKAKPKQEELLAQCQGCKAVKIRYTNGQVLWQSTFVSFANLPKESCYPCSLKVDKPVDMGINEAEVKQLEHADSLSVNTNKI